MCQTIQTEHLKVTCSKSGEKTPMQRSNCCTAKVCKVRTYIKPFKDSKRNPNEKLPIARNLRKFGRKVVEAISTDVIPY